jgi:hypothetical protein
MNTKEVFSRTKASIEDYQGQTPGSHHQSVGQTLR